jgi:lysophospholipase L1-like esterase
MGSRVKSWFARARALVYTAAAVALLAAGSASAAPVCVPGGPWTASWGTATDHAQAVGPWSNQTLRMVAHTSEGGSQVRIHLTDEFATSTAVFAHVSVAQQLDGAVSGPPAAVTFGGLDAVTIAAGADVVSDAVAFPTTPGERLLVSVYIPASTSITSAPMHTYAGETEYNIVGVDGTMMTSPPVSNSFNFTSYVAGVDVDATSADTVVAIGDSITDLADVPNDADVRWTDYLGRRTGLAIVNEGISGNWVTNGSGTGPSVTARFQHDALNIPGVRTVIIAAGINDLRNGVSAATLESAVAALVASGHAAGVRVLVATITPCAGDSQCTSSFETQRQAYNTWVRAGSSGADAVVDFDSAVGNGAALNPIYSTNSPLHPNSAGMLAMANAIDVSKL